MRELYPECYVPWDPCYGNPEDVLFTLILKDYDDMLRAKSGKKQYKLMANIQTELVEPFRWVQLSVACPPLHA